MKTYIIGVGANEIEVQADGLFYSFSDTGSLSFLVTENGKNRNIAVFAPGKWDYYMEAVV